MPKVIHIIKSIFHLELHRGLEKSPDPYTLNGVSPRKANGKPYWTLGAISLFTRCSSTYINRQKLIRAAGFASASLLLLFATLTLIPVTSTPDTAEAIDGTASQTTITLTKASADLSLTAVSSDGTFASSTSSEEAKFSVTTTNYTGYTLTIAASDNNQTLVNTDTSITTHNTFSTITSVIDEKTFDNATYNGQWGYKPSKMNSTVNVGFWPSPTQTATTLDVTEGANSTANNYTIALGARADYTQATGTYSKTMTLSATANPTPYSITYTDNTNDATVKNLPDISGSTTNATQITLSSVTPSRTGYVFKGWCDEAPTSSGTVCGGNSYTVSGSYPINQTTANVITLYATWEIPEYDMTIKTTTGVSSVSLNGTSCSSTSGCVVSDLVYGQAYTLTATLDSGYSFSSWYVDGLGNVASSTTISTTFTVGEGAATITANARYTMPAGTTMQTFTTAMCDAMPEEQSYLLTDTRDNTMYTVAKLKDGKCWMTQNLKLGAKDSSLTLTSADSNVSSAGFTLDNKLVDGLFPANSIADPTLGGTSYYYDGLAYYCTDDYGCYYNSYTATAGSMTSNTGPNETVDYSICPKGWSLPTGGESGQFRSLVVAYGHGVDSASDVASRLIVASPTTATENINGQYTPGFLLGGRYSSDSPVSFGASGGYWSRTAYSVGRDYHFYITATGYNSVDTIHKARGRSVRCVLQ